MASERHVFTTATPGDWCAPGTVHDGLYGEQVVVTRVVADTPHTPDHVTRWLVYGHVTTREESNA